MLKKVEISEKAKHGLKRLPVFIADKLLAWIKLVEKDGVEEIRKIKGFHDEPLKGERTGQRSIRLSRAYRAIYVIRKNGTCEILYIEEVTKHDY